MDENNPLPLYDSDVKPDISHVAVLISSNTFRLIGNKPTWHEISDFDSVKSIDFSYSL
ncbi:hypothetical protein [Nitrosopumilus sp.]|uniref:hypothetical protein n=1 Tax=Nitrosopumilus sp. TaxID=2024843 RepID=UPI00345B7F01